MERAAFSAMAAHEQNHWWFVGRRTVLKRLIEQLFPSNGSKLRILEAGCGSGGNLPMLAELGVVTAFERDVEAREIARQRRCASVIDGCLPDGIEHLDSSFDLIVLLDVLEHIEKDIESLTSLKRKLASGGRLLITVPAMPFLWSNHDVRHHHLRRYTPGSLRRVVEAAGLVVRDLGYFNALLFPLALIDRLLSKLIRRQDQTDNFPHPILNMAFAMVFRWERAFVGTRWHAPFGLSIFAVVACQ